MFRTGSAPGIHPSEQHARRGVRSVTTRTVPPTVSPVGDPDAVALGRPHGLRFLGFDPIESPSHAVRGLACRHGGCSPGFCPSRVLQQKPWPGFRPASSHALQRPTDESPNRLAPQSVNQPLLGPNVPPCRSTTFGRSDPLRVPAPASSQPFKRCPVRVMSSPRTASCITTDRPMLFGQAPSLYRS